jgi:hypothetical protein
MTKVLGYDLGHRDTVAAEHWLASVPDGPGLVACTHFVRDANPRVVVTISGSVFPVIGPASGPGNSASLHSPFSPANVPSSAAESAFAAADLPSSAAESPFSAAESEAASAAAQDHAAGRAGRAVLFPGVRDLTGTLTVEDLIAASAIDRVIVIGGPPAAPGTLIDTRDFVRPEWRDGSLVLIATPAPGGKIAPFEVPNPTPCCANH